MTAKKFIEDNKAVMEERVYIELSPYLVLGDAITENGVVVGFNVLRKSDKVWMGRKLYPDYKAVV